METPGSAFTETRNTGDGPRIGVWLPTWVGDACMATPTLRALRESFPQAHMTGIMRPVVRDLIDQAWGEASPWLDYALLYEKRGRRAGVSSRWGLIGTLRRQKLDLLVLLVNSFWAAAVARLAGVRAIGYDRDARGWLLSERVPAPREGKRFRPTSAVDYYLELAHQVGCTARNKRMQLELTKDEFRMAQRLWNELGFQAARPTVVINSNAATDRLRIWPEDKVRELALRLATERGYQVLLHCGPAEREAANRIAAEVNHPWVCSMGHADELPIGLSKAVLSIADVVVSSDSGPRHIAVAFDRPVVSLFGPTDVAWTTTYNVPETLVFESLDCRACYGKTCRLKHHRCMRDIQVERVFQAVVSRLPRLRHVA